MTTFKPDFHDERGTRDEDKRCINCLGLFEDHHNGECPVEDDQRIEELEKQLKIANHHADTQTGIIADYNERLEATEKQLEAVREYAAHKPYCTWFEGDRFVNRVCDCGLTAAIGEVKS